MRLGLFQGHVEKGLSRIYPVQAKLDTGEISDNLEMPGFI